MTRLLSWILLLMLPVAVVAEGSLGERVFQRVGFDQRPGMEVPHALVFRDASGRSQRLGQLFDGRPVVLALAYHRCPNLCGLTIAGLIEGLRAVPMEVGEDFQVVVASIDPRETPAIAAVEKAEAVERYGRGNGVGWHFLTADESTIAGLAEAVGFRYAYDPGLDQYAHAAGVVLLTGDGTISRYLYGVRFSGRDLRLGLTEAGEGRIGGLAEQVLLLCYHYNPETGAYGGLVMNVLRLTGTGTLLILGAFVGRSWLRERRRRMTWTSANGTSNRARERV